MGSEWQNWSEIVTQAGLIIIVVGVGVAAGLERIKQMWMVLTRKPVSAAFMAVTSALLSAAIAAYMMVQAGTPWYVALLACLAASCIPKAAHDGMGKLDRTKGGADEVEVVDDAPYS